MSNEEKEGVRRMVMETIMRLKKSNAEPGHIGTRYAKLISLLWRRPPRKRANPTQPGSATNQVEEFDLNQSANEALEVTNGDFSLNTFSWLDLDSVGHFATANNSISPSFMDFAHTTEEPIDPAYEAAPMDSNQWFNDRPQDLVF